MATGAERAGVSGWPAARCPAQLRHDVPVADRAVTLGAGDIGPCQFEHDRDLHARFSGAFAGRDEETAVLRDGPDRETFTQIFTHPSHN